MSNLSIEVVPFPAPDHATLLEYSARFKTLRLRSLKEDSTSFSSKYESEVNQPQEFWLNRLTDDRAVHLVLTRELTGVSDASLLQKQWVGLVVVVETVRATAISSSEWFMAAVYIEPEVRGQGLGKRLVQATIDHVKAHAPREGGMSLRINTSVLHGNNNALELYQRLGFHVIDPNERIEKEGTESLATKLSMEL